MPRKKKAKFVSTVIRTFSFKGVKYSIGSKFETNDKESNEILIKNKYTR